MNKGDRVRIYLYEIGNIYATVVQAPAVTGPLLLHIDGTREFDHRWVNPSHVHPESWAGEYDPARVSG
jgi:hypothetical protein